jgi:HEAT repeat protein
LSFDFHWEWPLRICISLYVLSAAAIMLSRLGHERRRRLIKRIEAAIDGSPGNKSPADDWEKTASRRIPSGAGRRLRYENYIPKAVNEAIAIFLFRIFGAERLAGVALGGRRYRSRWKRIAALRILALAGSSEALPLLGITLGDPDEEVAIASTIILGGMKDPAAAQKLASALEKGQVPASRIATFLHRFAVEVPEVLRPMFRSENTIVRYWAAVLGRRYSGESWIADELANMVDDPEPMVRKAALQSLGMLRVSASDAVLAALKDPVYYVQAHAARALAQMGAVQHAGEIAALLSSKEWWVRLAARESLLALFPGAENIVFDCLSHTDRFARNSAAEILQNAGVYARLLLEESGGASSNPERRRRLKQLMKAAGSKMAEAVIEQLPEHARGQARICLESIRISEDIPMRD